jgi:hypothetical protein
MATSSLVLRVVAGAGLMVDAYVHADLAPSYAGPGGTLGEQNLFLVEAGIALAAALLVLTTNRREASLMATLVAASALAAIVASRYVDLGPIGPLPDLYEPVWYPEKLVAVAGETTAAVAAALLLVRSPLTATTRRRARRPAGPPVRRPT